MGELENFRKENVRCSEWKWRMWMWIYRRKKI